jgi:hypothetical protein
MLGNKKGSHGRLNLSPLVIPPNILAMDIFSSLENFRHGWQVASSLGVKQFESQILCATVSRFDYFGGLQNTL